VLYFIRLLLRPIVTTLLSPLHRHCVHATSTLLAATSTLLACYIDTAYMPHRHCSAHYKVVTQNANLTLLPSKAKLIKKNKYPT